MTNQSRYNQQQSLSLPLIVDAARAAFAFGLLGAAISGALSAAIGFAFLHRAGAIDGLLLGVLAGFVITVLGVAIGGKWGAFASGAMIGYLGSAIGIALYDVGSRYSIDQTVEWSLQHPVAFMFAVCGALLAYVIAESLAPILLRYRSRPTTVASPGGMPLYQVSLPVRLAIAVAEMAPVAASITCVLRHMPLI